MAPIDLNLKHCFKGCIFTSIIFRIHNLQRFLRPLRGTSTDRHRPIQTGNGPAPTYLDRHQSRAGPYRVSTSTGTDRYRLDIDRHRPVQASWGRSGADLNRSVPVPRRDRKKRCIQFQCKLILFFA